MFRTVGFCGCLEFEEWSLEFWSRRYGVCLLGGCMLSEGFGCMDWRLWSEWGGVGLRSSLSGGSCCR